MVIIMDISKLDKNFALKGNIDKNDIVWYDASEKPFVLYGAAGSNPYIRVPLDVAKSVSNEIYALSTNTAGIRIRFKTNSPYVAINCQRNSGGMFSHMPNSGRSGFDMFSLAKNSRSQNFVNAFVPPKDSSNGYCSIVDVAGEMTDYTLNFPLYDTVDRLYIGIKEGCEISESIGYINDAPVVYYGSSITQGGCASRPGNSYQAFLSRMLDIDYINLGFSGNGVAQDGIVKYMASLDMCAFVSDYDHNASYEHLIKTHNVLYQKIREVHPDIPYIIVSRPDYKIGCREDDLRRIAVMKTFEQAILQGDKNVYFVDGAGLFADDEWQACTVDGCHPNDLGFYRFAKVLYPTLKHALGI